MLNFRCSDNRTFAVPRRLAMKQADAGLHTVIHGVGDLNYAIGSKESFLFRGHDATSFERLWKARLVRNVETDDQSENLKLRGSYTGLSPVSIRITFVNGKLVLDANWPEAPEPEEPEAPYVPQLNCNAEGVGLPLNLTITALPVYPKWDIAYNSFEVGDFRKFWANNEDPWVLDESDAAVCVVPFTTDVSYEAQAHTNDTYPALSGDHWVLVSAWEHKLVNESNALIGELCYRGGKVWRCISYHATHIESPNGDPGTGISSGLFWVEFSDFPSSVDSLAETNEYEEDDKVKKDDLVYICLADHLAVSSKEPEVGVDWETYWEDVTETEWIPASAAEVTIHQGTVFIGTYQANANGLLTVFLPANSYTIEATFGTLNPVVVELVKTSSEQDLAIEIP